MPELPERQDREPTAHQFNDRLVISPWSTRDMMQVSGRWVSAENPVEVRR